MLTPARLCQLGKGFSAGRTRLPSSPRSEQHPLPGTLWAGILWEQHRGGMQAPGVGTGADIPGPALKNVDIVSAPNSSTGVHSPWRRGTLGSEQDSAPGDQAAITWGDELPCHLQRSPHVMPRHLGTHSLFVLVLVALWPLPLNLQLRQLFLGKAGRT